MTVQNDWRKEMKKCPYCEADNNDFNLLNQTSEYSSIEIALNRQGMLRVRCHWDSDEGAAAQDIIELPNCPCCGKRFIYK